MKSRAVIPLVVGLGIGVVAIKMFFGILQNARGANQGELVEIVTAAADISPTLEVTENMVILKKIPRALIPEMAFQKKEEVVGRVSSVVIPNGTPIVPNLLAPPGTPPGMAVRIKEGYRAVAVQIDEFAGVAGYIKPEARVDVIAMMNTRNGGRSESVSKVILQDVEVLAVGQDMGQKTDADASVTRSVTLSVKPGDASRLHLAASKSGSKLRLALRSQHDRQHASVRPTTDKDLISGTYGQQASAPDNSGSLLSTIFGGQHKNGNDATDKASKGLADASARNEWVVEMINGNKVDQVRFADDSAQARRLDGGKSKGVTRQNWKPDREVHEVDNEEFGEPEGFDSEELDTDDSQWASEGEDPGDGVEEEPVNETGE